MGASPGRGPTLRWLRLQYRDFARWQRSWLQGEALEVQLSHWRSRLAGPLRCSSCPPIGRALGGEQRGRSMRSPCPLRLANALAGACAARGGDPLHDAPGRVHAAALALQRPARPPRGTPVPTATRRDRDVVGFFVNTLVLRADLSGDPSKGVPRPPARVCPMRMRTRTCPSSGWWRRCGPRR